VSASTIPRWIGDILVSSSPAFIGKMPKNSAYSVPGRSMNWPQTTANSTFCGLTAAGTNGWDLAAWNGPGAPGKHARKTSRTQVHLIGAMWTLHLICAVCSQESSSTTAPTPPADYRSREGDGALGDFGNRYPWELCTTITEGSWGYQPNAKVKSFATLIDLLVGAAGRDGNMLLNVGPKPDGTIDEAQAERVREIGQWLSANGESIYGTRGGPWLRAAYGVSTHRQNEIYVHLLQVPKEGKVSLPVLPVGVKRVAVLHGSDLHFQQTDGKLVIDLPAALIDPIDTVLKPEIEQPWTAAAVLPVPASF
jgi:hypothetical protein